MRITPDALKDALARLRNSDADGVIVPSLSTLGEEGLAFVAQAREANTRALVVTTERDTFTEHDALLLGCDGWLRADTKASRRFDPAKLQAWAFRRRAIATWRAQTTRRCVVTLDTDPDRPLDAYTEHLQHAGFTLTRAYDGLSMLRMLRHVEAHMLITSQTEDPEVLAHILAAQRYIPELQALMLVPNDDVPSVDRSLNAQGVQTHFESVVDSALVDFLRARWTQWLLGPPTHHGWNVATTPPEPLHVVVVDPEPTPAIRRSLDEAEQLVWFHASTVDHALDLIQRHAIHMALIRLDLPEAPGLQPFLRLRNTHPQLACALLAHAPHTHLAQLATRLGAQDTFNRDAPAPWLADRIVSAFIRHRLLSRAQGFASDLEVAEEALRQTTLKLQDVNRQLHALASRDPLTGLLNRRGFTAALRSTAVQLSPRTRFAALLIDLDDFKRVNERSGHVTGDVVLRTTAERLARGLRSRDHCGRIGGDEFLVLLHDVTLATAEATAERLRDTIAQPIPANQGLEHITASISAVVLNALPGDIEALLRAARDGLAMGKSTGKNRVSLTNLRAIVPPDE